MGRTFKFDFQMRQGKTVYTVTYNTMLATPVYLLFSMLIYMYWSIVQKTPHNILLYW